MVVADRNVAFVNKIVLKFYFNNYKVMILILKKRKTNVGKA